MATETEQAMPSDITLVSDPTAPPPTLQEPSPDTSNVQQSTMPALDPSSLPPPGATAPVGQAAGRGNDSSMLPPLVPHNHSFRATPSRGKKNGAHPPLTLNQLAIVAASQNKLPASRVKGIVVRMGRHTQSSAGKLGRWYKSDSYVDNGNYSWRNMQLFADYQNQMYTPTGTIKASCKK